MKIDLLEQLKAEAKSHANGSTGRFEAARSLLMVTDTATVSVDAAEKKSDGVKFWLSPHDNALISAMVRDAGLEGFRCNRSQIVRAGVRLLGQLSREQLVAAVESTIGSSNCRADIEIQTTPPTT